MTTKTLTPLQAAQRGVDRRAAALRGGALYRQAAENQDPMKKQKEQKREEAAWNRLMTKPRGT